MPSKTGKQINSAVCDCGRDFRGGQRQSYNLATGLREKSVAVRAYCPAENPLMDKFKEAGIEVDAIEYNSIKLPFIAQLLASKLQTDGVNIFQASDSHSHNIGAFVKAFYPGIRLVVTVRTCFGRPNPFKMLLKYSERSVDQFIAISSAVQDHLIDMGVRQDRIKIIHSCYDKNIFNDSGREESGRLRIGTAATLERGKGIGIILESLSRLKNKLDNFVFLIAGEGPEREMLEQQTREYGLNNNVEFLGFTRDMAGFYRNLDVYVLASQSEGLGSSLLEAGACGAVLVSSKAGGTVDIITDGVNGRMFNVGEAGELTRIIYELSRASDLRSKFKKEFDKKLIQFDKEYMVEKYIKLYQELLES